MDILELQKPELEKIQVRLAAFKCPICGANHFTVNPTVYHFVYTLPEGGMMMSRCRDRVVMAYCDDCGYALTFRVNP